ncbi:phage tail protein [Clostridium sp. CX1]|uniref:phage tail protein n=1 Tax=Clostridium sp. CX1 TaxID=2978346 RepID=UPI0021BFDFBE|nr:phage tail protein [Clostridium sp. CX1]MCT8975498.1 phage tail protein [Clostridium sp. CX1]
MEKLQKKLEEVPKKVPIVTARAINRSASTAKTQAGRLIRETYIVKQRDVTSTIKIKNASSENLSAEIKSTGSVLELMKFKVRANKSLPAHGRYAVVSVKKGSSKMINGSFVTSMGNSHTNVFTRVSKKRLPIRGHYGPSVPQMLGNENVISKIEEKAAEVLETRLEHEVSRVLGGS